MTPPTVTRSLALAGVLVAALSLSACDLTELNEDPNNSAVPTTGYLLSSSQVNLADDYWGSFNNGRFGLLYAQYWTQNQYNDEDRYQYREAIPNNYWNGFYLRINNLEEIKRVISANPEGFSAPETQMAVAEVMQVFAYHVLTDIWGAVPYTEALQGSEDRAPAYTVQEEIYPDLIRRLTAAQAQIDVEAEVPGDLIYGGDAGEWKKFANSLKMRIAMRMADRLPSEAATAIQEAIAAGPMEEVEDSAVFSFEGSQPYSNPIWENYNINNRDDWAVTQGLVSILQGNDDPRLSIYVDPTPQSVDAGNPAYVGLPYGLANGVAAAIPRSTFSRPGIRVRRATSPAILMLYDEVLFIKAEAVERGFISGDSDALLADAVRASFEYWGVTDQAAIDSYIGDLDDVNGSNYKQVIGVQKWLALYMQGVQGWSEWRRLDFTGVLVPPAGGKGDTFEGPIPVRYIYPTKEGTLNGGNLAAAVGAQGPDTQGTLLWWDVNRLGS